MFNVMDTLYPICDSHFGEVYMSPSGLILRRDRDSLEWVLTDTDNNVIYSSPYRLAVAIEYGLHIDFINSFYE